VTAPAALSMIGDAARPFVALADGDPLTGRLFAANRPGRREDRAAAGNRRASSRLSAILLVQIKPAHAAIR